MESGFNHFSDSERFIQLFLELVVGIQALFCVVSLQGIGVLNLLRDVCLSCA